MKGISKRVPYLLFTRLQIDEAESDALLPLDFQSKNLLFLLSSFYQLLLDLLSLLFWRLTASTSNKINIIWLLLKDVGEETKSWQISNTYGQFRSFYTRLPFLELSRTFSILTFRYNNKHLHFCGSGLSDF